MALFARKQKPFATPLALERQRLAQKRQREIAVERRRQQWQRFVGKYLRLLIGAVSLMLLMIVITFFIVTLHREQVYVVSEITFYGNQRIPSEELRLALEVYKGGSLLTISRHELTSRLKTQFTYLDQVSLTKLIPGKLEVGIVEKLPASVIINLAGAYLLDKNALVLAVIKSTPAEGITFEQSQIVAGYGDPNAAIVRELYLSKIAKVEDRAKVDWATVPLAEKESSLLEIQQTLAARLAQQLKSGIDAVELSEFKDLNRLFTYENVEYTRGEVIDDSYILISQRVNAYFNVRDELKVNEILWQSPYTIRVSVVSGKRFILSSIDDLDAQLAKLEPIIKNGLLAQGWSFDLRGAKIVVR